MDSNYFNLSIGLFFIILGFFLFFRHSPNRRSNILLGTLFLIIGIYTELINFHFHSVHTKDISHLSHYLPFDALLLMLMSPCLYFYVLLLLDRPIKLIRWSMFVHAIPLLPCVLFNVLFYCRPVDDRVKWLIQDFNSGSTEMIIINAILYIQIIFYLILSFQAVRIQMKISMYVVKNGFRTDITWVRQFLLVNILIILISLPVCFWINNERTSIYIGKAAMNIDFLFLFVMKVFKNGIVDTEKIEEKKTPYQINKELTGSQWNNLKAYMDTSKPYLDENCSLHSVAEAIKITESQLSKILHAHGEISFADYINGFRLKKAIILLKDTSKYKKSIDTIASDCGFGSPSSFYRAFRKAYSITPSEFRKKNDANAEDIDDE